MLIDKRYPYVEYKDRILVNLTTAPIEVMTRIGSVYTVVGRLEPLDVKWEPILMRRSNSRFQYPLMEDVEEYEVSAWFPPGLEALFQDKRVAHVVLEADLIEFIRSDKDHKFHPWLGKGVTRSASLYPLDHDTLGVAFWYYALE